MTENVFTNAFNGMADAVANFATTGRFNFRSLTVSILADRQRWRRVSPPLRRWEDI
ncbi:hypothetical protein DOE63_11865 [Salmonella enterica subsp. diarizonae serovar 59:z10:-]|nr:hypothetical protein DOE63_11865 [Salmonella enterica subsp. diarizonae serovar 59:z10:-]